MAGKLVDVIAKFNPFCRSETSVSLKDLEHKLIIVDTRCIRKEKVRPSSSVLWYRHIAWVTCAQPVKGWSHHKGLRPLVFSNSSVGSFTSHKNQTSESAVRRDLQLFVLIRED